MKTRLNRPVDITDAPEHRSIPIGQVELQSDTPGELVLTGYASTFEPYEMLGGPQSGYGWIEQLDRGAFDVTLGGKPDLHLLINHEGTPLARTKSETLQLRTDDHGLHVTAKLDRANPLVQGLESAMKRGDMDEMSFAFRVKGQEWSATDDFPEDEQAYRKITEVSLHKGDVSIVNFGANPTTSAALRALADLEDMTELRDENSEVLSKVVEVVQTALKAGKAVDEVRKDLPAPSSEIFAPTPTNDSVLQGVLVALGERLGKLESALEARVTAETPPMVAIIDNHTQTPPEPSEAREEVPEENEGISLEDALIEMGIIPDGDISLDTALALL